MSVWLVRAGSSGEKSSHFREDGCISIGYNLTDDLTDKATWPDIRASLRKSNGSARRPQIDQVWQFLWTIQEGDLILTPASSGFTEVMVGRVSEGRPWFNSHAAINGDHGHRRKVEWATSLLELTNQVATKYRLWSVRRTVYRIAESDLDFWMSVVASEPGGSVLLPPS